MKWRTTRIQIETQQLLVIRRQRLVRSWCDRCGADSEFVSLEDLKRLRGDTSPQLISTPQLDSVEAQDGSVLVCIGPKCLRPELMAPTWQQLASGPNPTSARRNAMFTALTGLAALSFSVGGYFMKLSAGLTQLRPTLLMFTCFSVGAVFQTVAMSGESMAITYIVVLGFEAITALSLSMVLLNERATLAKLAGVGLVIVGIALLRLGKS